MNDFDPQAPLIGSDGLEYACFADRILGEPVNCWRNENIKNARASGIPEARIRTWVAAYDGTPPRLHEHSDEIQPIARHTRANFAVSEHGFGLCDLADVPGPQARDAEGTRAAGDLQAAPDPVHAAN